MGETEGGAKIHKKAEARGIPQKLRLAVFQRDGHRCWTCRSKEDLRVAHAFPLSRGGETVFWNLVTLCIKCWRAKGKKTPPEFLESYYYQTTVLSRYEPAEEIKKVRVVFKNGHTVEGEMKVDPGILGDFSIRVKSRGIIRLLPKSKIEQIDLLEDLTSKEP